MSQRSASSSKMLAVLLLFDAEDEKAVAHPGV